jgi:hypothetical protein
MRIYPQVPARMAWVALGDVVCVAALAVCVVFGMTAYAAVSELGRIGAAVAGTGKAIEESFDDAGDSVRSAPIVGKKLNRTLHGAGRKAGRPLVQQGRRQQRKVEHLARVVGWLTGAFPAFMVLIVFLPWRLRVIMRLSAAQSALAAGAEHPELLAQRAVYSLPYTTLARYSRDPFGDFAAGHYGALVQAALEDAGLTKLPASKDRRLTAG